MNREILAWGGGGMAAAGLWLIVLSQRAYSVCTGVLSVLAAHCTPAIGAHWAGITLLVAGIGILIAALVTSARSR